MSSTAHVSESEAPENQTMEHSELESIQALGYSSSEAKELVEARSLDTDHVVRYREQGVTSYQDIAECDDLGILPHNIEEYTAAGYQERSEIIELAQSGISSYFAVNAAEQGYSGIETLKKVQDAIRHNGVTHVKVAANSISSIQRSIRGNLGAEKGGMLLAAHVAPYRTWQILLAEAESGLQNFHKALFQASPETRKTAITLIEELSETPTAAEGIGYLEILTN